MKFFQWERDGRKLPTSTGRSPVVTGDSSKVAHVVSENAAYITVQMEHVIASLEPFRDPPICPKCQSSAIATEYGTTYYIPKHPDEERVKMEYVSMALHPTGSYHDGPEYLVRSCTVCRYAWAEHIAKADNA